MNPDDISVRNQRTSVGDMTDADDKDHVTDCTFIHKSEPEVP